MKRLNIWMKREDGFTLIEMSLVLFIISALLLLFVPNIANRQEGANKTSDEAIITVLQSQVDMYTMDKDVVPATFIVMETDGYLTEKQADKADDGFILEAGVVKPKVTPSE